MAFSTTVLIACGNGSDDSEPSTTFTVVSDGTETPDTGSTETPTETTDTGSTVTPTETTNTGTTENTGTTDTPPETTDPEATDPETGTDDPETGTDGGETTTTNPTTEQVQIGIFGPPQFLQAECGSVATGTVEATNAAASPMSVNQLVQGQLVEGSTILNYDLWEITLQPGNYHLVADYWNADLEFGAVGLEINSLADGDEQRLGRDSLAGYDGRLYSFLTIENPTTLSLKIDPVHDSAMNYVMGIFANGATVPSPRFINCPPATRIGLNEPQSLLLPTVDRVDDFQWFRMTLTAGVYFLDASMNSVEDIAMGYEFELLDRFGEDESVSRISRESGFTNLLMTTDQFTVLENIDVWIRARSVHDDKTVEFTVYQ